MPTLETVNARAARIDREKRDRENEALLATLFVLAHVKTDARFAYRHQQDIPLTISRTLTGFGNNRGIVNVLADQMAAANLQARQRTVEDAKDESGLSEIYLAGLLAELPDDQVDELVQQYVPAAQKLVSDLADRVGTTVADAVQGNEDAEPDLKQPGLGVVSSALRSAGVVVPTEADPDAAFAVEQMIEYAVGVGYGDGQQHVLNDPKVSQALAAYTYTTMRDNRVRPLHKKLDGMTRPPTDPVWLTVTPPTWMVQGVPQYGCRCWRVPRWGNVTMTDVPAGF